MDEKTLTYDSYKIETIIRKTIAKYAIAYTTDADDDLVIACKHNMEVIFHEFDLCEFDDDTLQAFRLVELKTPTAEFSFYETLEFTEYGWERTTDTPHLTI